MQKKERDIASNSFSHYEKHYLLNNTITCAFFYLYLVSYKNRAKLSPLFVHYYQFVSFSVHAKYFHTRISTYIVT